MTSSIKQKLDEGQLVRLLGIGLLADPRLVELAGQGAVGVIGKAVQADVHPAVEFRGRLRAFGSQNQGKRQNQHGGRRESMHHRGLSQQDIATFGLL